MRLVDKVKRAAVISSVGLCSLFHSGCESMNNAPGFSMDVLSALAGARGAYMGAQGNNIGAAAGAGLQRVTGGLADYQRQKAIAEAGKNQQTVYVNTQQPQQNLTQIARQRQINLIYTANLREDSNENRPAEIDELMGYRKSSFDSLEPIECGIVIFNGSPTNLKLYLENAVTGDKLYESPEFKLLGNSDGARVDFKSGNLSPGIYKFTVKCNDNIELGSRLFKVTN